MNLADLFTSAGINIGFAILFLSLYSVFSKQPGNAGVYYTRDLLKDRRDARAHKEHRTLESFIPSVGWLIRAWRATEDDILQSAGLDAVVFLRIFIFSIRLFALCSVIGIFVLVPTTFTVQHEESTEDWAQQDFDRFSITNIDSGSKRFWVHFGAIYVISFIVYVMLYMEYKTLSKKRLQYLFEARPQPDQFSALVLAIPKDPDGRSYSDSVQDFFSRFHSVTYLSHQMVYNASKVEGMILKLEIVKREIEYLKRQPAGERQPQREGCCGLYGPKVDPIEKKIKKLQDLYLQIREAQHEILHKQKEVPAAIVSFKSRWGAAVAAQSMQAENPLTWVTQWAPEPRDVYWPNLSMPSAQAWMRQIISGVVVFLITIFYCIPSAFIVAINSVQDLQNLLPESLQIILELPGLQEFVSGYLSTVLLAGLLYMIPPTLLFLSRLEGHPSKSSQERKACEKFFYFLAGPIFFIQVLGGGAVQVASEWDFIKNPADIPYRLAAHIPGQATFFMSYIMTTGWAGFPLEILNISTLILNYFKRHTTKADNGLPELELYSLPYHRIVPNVLLFIFVGIIYSAIAPLLPPFVLVYFILGYVIFKNQIMRVYDPSYETAGQYWPLVHSRIIAGLAVMQITFVGIFEAKMSTKVSMLTVPLPIITIIFHQYCNKRFYPIFKNYSVESTKKKDLEDERRGIENQIFDTIPGAYLHPGLKPVDISEFGNPEAGPLLPSDSLP
ncbi:unnamed protein product [Calypogeia fissa]